MRLAAAAAEARRLESSIAASKAEAQELQGAIMSEREEVKVLQGQVQRLEAVRSDEAKDSEAIQRLANGGLWYGPTSHLHPQHGLRDCI